MMCLPNGITTVGIELEGYWKASTRLAQVNCDDVCQHCAEEFDEAGDLIDGRSLCEECLWEATDLKEDGSVHYTNGIAPSHIAGEWASPILSSWAACVEAVRYNYPQQVSNLCGLHVHIGCDTRARRDFSIAPAYWKLLINRVEGLMPAQVTGRTAEWLTHRIKYGRSDETTTAYCVPNSMSERYGRYQHVNYGAYTDHGTIEVRLLPMSDHGAEEALCMIQAVLLSTSDYWTQPMYWDTEDQTISVEEDVILEPDEPITEAVSEIAYTVKGSVDHPEEEDQIDEDHTPQSDDTADDHEGD